MCCFFGAASAAAAVAVAFNNDSAAFSGVVDTFKPVAKFNNAPSLFARQSNDTFITTNQTNNIHPAHHQQQTSRRVQSSAPPFTYT